MSPSPSGMIVLEVDGRPNAVGSIQMSFSSWDGTTFENGVYRTSAAGSFVQISFYDHVLDALGPEAGEIIQESIRGGISQGYPMLHVDPLFRWAGDYQMPHQMGVQFERFEVQRGCRPQAVACDQTEAVQVIPLDRLYYPAPTWTGNEIEVISANP